MYDQLTVYSYILEFMFEIFTFMLYIVSDLIEFVVLYVLYFFNFDIRVLKIINTVKLKIVYKHWETRSYKLDLII